MTKNILHPDYWVEVPEGEFLVGLSIEQHKTIKERIRNQVGYQHFSTEQHKLIENIVLKLQKRAKQAGEQPSILYPLNLNEEEKAIWHEPFSIILNVENILSSIPIDKKIWLDTFYIARFPITKMQHSQFEMSIEDLFGALEYSSDNREAAAIQLEDALYFCEKLGGRLPIKQEWEKAARGRDGRLYPWGDNWDSHAGFFVYGQIASGGKRVDAFPRGVSPYGVWGMAGGLPELVLSNRSQSHTTKGCHARESSTQMAWFDHLIIAPSKGDWVSVRPVLDKWPVQQWQGIGLDSFKQKTQSLEKNDILSDILLPQFNWSSLTNEIFDMLEPAIVLLKDGQRAECKKLLFALLKKGVRHEAVWLLLAVAVIDTTKQQDCIQQALTLNPKSDVGRKLAKLLAYPARIKW